jgi:hypothetical protein
MRRAIGWFIVCALAGVTVLVSMALPAWAHDGLSATSVFWTVVVLVLVVLAWRRLMAARAASNAQATPPR